MQKLHLVAATLTLIVAADAYSQSQTRYVTTSRPRSLRTGPAPKDWLHQSISARVALEKRESTLKASLENAELGVNARLTGYLEIEGGGGQTLEGFAANLRTETDEILDLCNAVTTASDSYAEALEKAQPLFEKASQNFKAYGNATTYPKLKHRYELIANLLAAFAEKYGREASKTVRPGTSRVEAMLSYVNEIRLLAERLEDLSQLLPGDSAITEELTRPVEDYVKHLEELRRVLHEFQDAIEWDDVDQPQKGIEQRSPQPQRRFYDGPESVAVKRSIQRLDGLSISGMYRNGVFTAGAQGPSILRRVLQTRGEHLDSSVDSIVHVHNVRWALWDNAQELVDSGLLQY